MFGNRWMILIAATLGLLIALPSLSTGLWMDDYQQRISLLTHSEINPFEFYRMGTAQTQDLLQRGVLPWWTYPTAKLAFFRPVAHWLMQVDYRLWPDNIALMHLHSVIWYALLVAVAGLAYRRLMASSMIAGLAALMFAVDAGHGGAVSWIANRNAVVAMAGSMLVLLCYRRLRWYWLLAGCALFALTLACAEAALAITGYLFAYEVFLSERRWTERVLRLTPYALIAVLWLAFWRYRGYGSAGPGFYTDPGSDPREFLRGLIYRAPSFLFGQFSIIPVEVPGLFEDTPWRNYVWAVVLVACGLAGKLFWPLLKKSALARFFALGMCIALIPICGSQLVSRSLWYVSFGAIGLLALLVNEYFSFDAKPKNSFTLFVYAMLVVHLLVSPLLFLVDENIGSMLDKYIDPKNLHLSGDGARNKRVLAISVHQFEANTYYPLFKDEALSLESSAGSTTGISKLRLLTNGVGEFELSREDENTLVVRSENGFDQMRKGRYGFAKGEKVELDDVTITVRKINANRAATEIEYRFKPGVLNDYEIIAWGGKYFVPAQLPAKGMKMLIKVQSS